MDEKANALVQEFVSFAGGQVEPTRLLAGELRWQVANDRFPPAVVILRRGKRQPGQSNYVATISNDGAYASLYPSWEPVIRSWLSKRITNAGRRVNHKEITNGEMPKEGVPT